MSAMNPQPREPRDERDPLRQPRSQPYHRPSQRELVRLAMLETHRDVYPIREK